MKVFFTVLVLALSVFAQDSPLSTISKLERIPGDFMMYAKKSSLVKNEEPTDELLRAKIFELFDLTLAGKPLKEAKDDVYRGLSKGWVLANTGAFDWAFPLLPQRIGPAKLIFNNGREALVEYPSRAMNTLVLEDDSISHKLKGIYQDFRVTSPPLKQLLTEAQLSGDFVYHVKSDCRAVFRLKKTSAGWRVVDWEELLLSSQMISEG